jgi:cell division GTPase FtsZ
MASGTWTLRGIKFNDYSGMSQSDLLEILETLIPDEIIKEEKHMSPTNGNKDDTYINAPDAGDDFDFVMAYDDDPAEADERLLPENVAASAISCGFIGVGGGGGKLAKAFLDLGFNKTILVNTTEKDQPGGLDASHFVLVPGADGVGKDITLGKQVLQENSAFVEDAVRTRLGQIDWLFVCAGGGGGTGSACHELHGSLSRYLSSIESSGKVVYIITKPTAQEMLNPTISKNYKSLMEDISETPHILIDNEKQLQLLRGKVGMMNMFPSANRNFAKLLAQVLKLADEHTEIQTFDTKDLEKCLSTDGRMVIGSTVVRDVTRSDLGSLVYQGCLRSSPCPTPTSGGATGTLLLIVNSSMATDPDVSRRLESAFSYVGGRAATLFSGVYVKEGIPGLIAITLLGGL